MLYEVITRKQPLSFEEVEPVGIALGGHDRRRGIHHDHAEAGKHHAKCETPEDPHSPQIVGINRVLWGGVFLYVKESHNQETMERYGHGTP